MKTLKIAIDGPASSGKSTVAKKIAQKFGYTYLDTGAMYRSATYLTLESGLKLSDVEGILTLLKENPISFQKGQEGEQLVFVGEKDVTLVIRQNEVTNHVSLVAALPEVRRELVRQQRAIAQSGGIVMDGRDIGTVVLPDAELKIFLVASVEERAQRRLKENQSKGIAPNFEQLKKEISERDYKDSHREDSPLKAAEDAITFDTTGVSIEDVVTFISKKAEKLLTQ